MNNVPVTDDGNPSLGQILASLNELKENVVTKNMLSEYFLPTSLTVSASSETPQCQILQPSIASVAETVQQLPIVPLSPSAPPIDEVESMAPALFDQFLAP